MADYRPDPRILSLGNDFFDPVEPARFPEAKQRFFNKRWSQRIGIALDEDSARARHFWLFEPLPDNLPEPLALRYHGHQFRSYNPDIGDGRGFLFAQLRDDAGRLLDLATKGSGTTPYSRFGDGRLTLKGAVREVLATEMLEALGVNTSKTFVVFETGEQLHRGDEPSPTRSAVLTRLSHSHIRIGTFQRLAYFEERENIDRLVRYCLEHLFGEPLSEEADANALRLLQLVSEATAALAASYLAAGFVHGVLNTDNINVTGESFDYGPWRFTPDWDATFTAAYFDQYGLYAFGRQPEAIQWNVAQLAGCLTLVADGKVIAEIVEGWAGRFEKALVGAMLRRLGVAPSRPEDDRKLTATLIRALETRDVQIDRLFFDWRGGRDPGTAAYGGDAFRALAAALEGRATECGHPYWGDEQPCSMHIDEVEAIWSDIADSDDWSRFESKVAAVRRMGEAMAEGAA
ncbi:YdiU family protein [Sphingomonas piscis]|uniref:YdiU family protein n=1 Tax=Sphingomonas piscis TaxID=2714943 RepID=A0A6G7YN90_9SPHN|nr:YdiU family protein [Sphingomonas piscis]QIK78208.1 YdiU family protein [Sphingomonas piscis]